MGCTSCLERSLQDAQRALTKLRAEHEALRAERDVLRTELLTLRFQQQQQPQLPPVWQPPTIITCEGTP